MPDLSLIGGLAVGAGQSLANYGMQAMFGDREQRQYEKNVRRNYELSQEAQRNAAKNTVDGLKLAGLSPALATGQSFTPAAMSAAPLQNKSVPAMDMASMFQAMKQLDIMDAEKEALKGQAAKTQAEADKTKIESGRMSKEDAEAKNAMLRSLERIEAHYKNAGIPIDDIQRFRDDLLNAEGWNAGALKANLDSLNYEKALSHVNASEVDDALDMLVGQRKIKVEVAGDITSMSHSQRKLLAKQVSLAVKQLSLISAQTNLASSEQAVNQSKLASMLEERKKLQEEQKYIAQQMEQSKATTNKIKNSDFQSAYESGDGLKTIRILGLEGLESLLKILGLLATRGK